jgi:hypothetical protein
VVPEGQQDECVGEEFDFAELDNGDLFVVMRVETLPTGDTKEPGQARRQSRLIKRGKTWETTLVRPAPFPHSGHPELLQTREGLIFHMATSGLSWTADEGEPLR